MLEATVIGIREGLEAALVVGFILAYLSRSGRSELFRYVYAGLILAVVTSVLAAVGIVRLGLDPENEVAEGVLFLVAGAFVATMVAWMWRAGRTLRTGLEARVERLLDAPAQPGTRRTAAGLGILTFVMVFREGFETVLFLGALSAAIRGNPLNNAIGGTSGILLAVAFGALLLRGSLRISLHRFFLLTGAVLLALVLKLIANGIHEFAEVGLLRLGERALAVIGFLTKESTTVLILIAFLLIPAGVVVLETWQASARDEARERGPAMRKRLAATRASRRWAAASGAVALGMSLMLAVSYVSAAARGVEPPLLQAPMQGDHIHIPLEAIERARMYKYAHASRDTTVRFFIIRRPDDSLAVALDACGICPPKGYYLDGDVVICRNCDAPINLDTIGQGGGCNPIPLRFATDGTAVDIQIADLLKDGLGRFAGR